MYNVWGPHMARTVDSPSLRATRPGQRLQKAIEAMPQSKKLIYP